MVIHDIDPELVRLPPEICPDPQDRLANPVSIPHFLSCPRISVSLVQDGHHGIALIDGFYVFLKDVRNVIMRRGYLLGQNDFQCPGNGACRTGSDSRSTPQG